MELAEAYMALGGVPYYWGFLKPGLSLAKNMDMLFFASDAKLRLEFSQLFASLFKNPEPYVRIVNALGSQSDGNTRGVQIDLLIDRDDRVVNLCEMKFCEGMFNVDAQCDESLRRKREVFVQKTGTRKAVHLTLVTTNGLAGTKYRGVFQSVITLNDLFRPVFTGGQS